MTWRRKELGHQQPWFLRTVECCICCCAPRENGLKKAKTLTSYLDPLFVCNWAKSHGQRENALRYCWYCLIALSQSWSYHSCYNHIIVITLSSNERQVIPNSPAFRLFVQHFPADMIRRTKAPHRWPFVKGITRGWRVPSQWFSDG